MVELWAKVPNEIKQAVYGLILGVIAAAGAAIKMWMSARFYKATTTNLVEAIEEGGCEVTKAASKRRNTATGIEKPFSKFVKKTVAFKLPTVEGGSDEKEGNDETPRTQPPAA